MIINHYDRNSRHVRADPRRSSRVRNSPSNGDCRMLNLFSRFLPSVRQSHSPMVDLSALGLRTQLSRHVYVI